MDKSSTVQHIILSMFYSKLILFTSFKTDRKQYTLHSWETAMKWTRHVCTWSNICPNHHSRCNSRITWPTVISPWQSQGRSHILLLPLKKAKFPYQNQKVQKCNFLLLKLLPFPKVIIRDYIPTRCILTQAMSLQSFIEITKTDLEKSAKMWCFVFIIKQK